MYLLLSANHKAGKWRGVDVLRGQHITSTENIAVNTGLSRQKVRTALEKLKSTGEITTESTNKYSLITIVKWELYQHGVEDSNNQPNHAATNNQPASQPSNNHKQEVKQIKNEKNARRETPNAPSADEGGPLQMVCKSHSEEAALETIRNSFVFGHELSQTITTWLTYKREKKQAYKPSGLNSLLSQIQKYARQYGEDVVSHAIAESMASNYQGIVWDKVKTATPQNSGNPFLQLARQLDENERSNYIYDT